MVTLIGFLLIGPYSYLAGAISLDFGGKQGSSTASGFIDGIGYLGGMLAGDSMARMVVSHGWKGAFLASESWPSSRPWPPCSSCSSNCGRKARTEPLTEPA